jgi:Acyl-CoA reductase (LuxC)
MGLKIKLSKGELDKLKVRIGKNEKVFIKFYNEKEEYLEIWDVKYEIGITEPENTKEKVRIVEITGKMEEDQEMNEENDERNGITEEENLENENKFKEVKIGDHQTSDQEIHEESNSENEDKETENTEMDDSELENEEEIIQSERLQILINKLNQKMEKINDEVMEERSENLSLKQLCQRIRRRNQMLLEDYYYVGEKFKERLTEEMSKRREKDRRRKTDQKERKKIYKEMIETGVERSMKALKRMVAKGEKVYRLIRGVGKEKLGSICDITTVENCNKEEIEEAIRYFRNQNGINKENIEK